MRQREGVSSGFQQDKGMLCPLGGLQARSQLLASTSTGIMWEKVTLTVGIGASDTVIPPHCFKWCEMMHIEKVGT